MAPPSNGRCPLHFPRAHLPPAASCSAIHVQHPAFTTALEAAPQPKMVHAVQLLHAVEDIQDLQGMDRSRLLLMQRLLARASCFCSVATPGPAASELLLAAYAFSAAQKLLLRARCNLPGSEAAATIQVTCLFEGADILPRSQLVDRRSGRPSQYPPETVEKDAMTQMLARSAQ